MREYQEKSSELSGWQYLLDQANNTTYLGKIKSRWKVVYRNPERISITLFKERMLRSVFGSVFLLVFIIAIVFTKGFQSNSLWLLCIPLVWLLIGWRFGYRKELIWEKNKDEISFVFVFFLLTKKVILDRKSISAKLKYSDKSQGKEKEAVVVLYNAEYPNTCLELVSSVKDSWIIPVAVNLKKILGGNVSDETGVA